jgi:hypothetical protein
MSSFVMLSTKVTEKTFSSEWIILWKHTNRTCVRNGLRDFSITLYYEVLFWKN